MGAIIEQVPIGMSQTTSIAYQRKTGGLSGQLNGRAKQMKRMFVVFIAGAAAGIAWLKSENPNKELSRDCINGLGYCVGCCPWP